MQPGAPPRTSVRLSGFTCADFRYMLSVKQDLMCQLSQFRCLASGELTFHFYSSKNKIFI